MKKFNKFVITAKVAVIAKNKKEAEELFLEQLSRTGSDNHPCADTLIEDCDEDTKVVTVEEGIWTADKIKITGYDGIEIETCIGRQLLTKYGDTFTIKAWNEETRVFEFEEKDDAGEHETLHESRISFG